MVYVVFVSTSRYKIFDLKKDGDLVSDLIFYKEIISNVINYLIEKGNPFCGMVRHCGRFNGMIQYKTMSS